jgi:hypothetical protein
MAKAKLLLMFSLCAILGVFVFWGAISDAYGPMEQAESQCLICQRGRVERSVCGSQVKDEITTSQYSDWIDTFVSSEHEHVWLVYSHSNRRNWFGNQAIACGGIPALSMIFSRRGELGEQKAQELVRKFHELVKAKPRFDFEELNVFTNTIADDPNSLLDANAAKRK